MQSLRDILRSNLRTSLNALSPLDRLAASWPVAAGHAIAERSAIVRLEDGRAVAEVRDPVWISELRANTPALAADLARISGVPVTDILFVTARPGQPAAPAHTDTPHDRSGNHRKPRPERRSTGRRTPG